MTGFSARNALIAQRLERAPRPLRFGVGVAAVIAGVLVLARPSLSLDLLATLVGIGALLEGVLALWEFEASPRWRHITAALWGIAGIVLLLAQWLTVWVLMVFICVGLLAVGVTRIVRAFRGKRPIDERLATATFGIAAIVFSVVAFVWRDVSMIVLGVVFAAWLIITGIDNIWRALRGDREQTTPKGQGLVRRFIRTTLALVTVTAAALGVAVTVAVTREEAITDVFYAAPRDLPEAPGQLIRAEKFTRGVPEGARGWRILYSTSDRSGTIGIASALVVAPDDDELHPVISWGHGTTGYARACAPSLLPEPFKSGGMYGLRQITSQGWAMVATDYPGLGTEGAQPYLIGFDSGHAVLDATRAARQLDDTRISRRTVLWGHSQGGHAALWASEVAASYAPDLKVLGTAAISPASDLPALVDDMEHVVGGAVLESFVLASYAAKYPNVNSSDYLRPGTEFAMREYPKRCLSSPESVVSALSVAARVADPQMFRTNPGTGALGARLRENIPAPSKDTPLLLVDGTSDALISPSVQQSYVSMLCAKGQAVDFRELSGQDHVSMLYGNSTFLPELVSWTHDRFWYEPATPTCGK